MTSISANLSTMQSPSNLFGKIDGNADGTVSKDEFLSGRPNDVSESQAADLFGAIDSDSSGDISEAELSAHFTENAPAEDSSRTNIAGNLSDEMLSALLALLTGATENSAPADADDGGAPSASEQFSAMDSDGDSLVSAAEFLAAKPDNMSEDQALALFNGIDDEGTGSITLEQFEASMTPAAGTPQPAATGAPAAGGGGGNSAEETYDPLDTNEDGVVDLQELMASVGSSSEEADSAQDDLTTRLLQRLEKAVQSYAAADRGAGSQNASLLADA